MNALTGTAKGQITLKKELFRHLGIHAGEKIEVTKVPCGELRIRAARPTGKIQHFFESLKRDGQRAVSIEDLDKAIEKGWSGQP